MLIAIEGCIGVGKSTVAQGLAVHRNSRVLLEDHSTNPYLPAFYRDPANYIIETEFSFLLSHYSQLHQHAATATQCELVADFHLGKDLLFAELNLVDDRMKHIFKNLSKLLQENVPKPDLLLCLSSSNELILDRISARQRDIEMQTTPEYFEAVNDAYETFFTQYCERKIVISMDEWDFVRQPELYCKLSCMIDSIITMA